MNDFNIRPAAPGDLTRLTELLPQLADFDVPEHRNPKDLWAGDLVLIQQILTNKAPHSFAEVAVNDAGTILGFIIVTVREELMSHAPSAHLEAIVVAPEGRGKGLGRKLLTRAEEQAKAAGAQSLSLHVFANNQRARSLYDDFGFDSELIRAIKWFD